MGANQKVLNMRRLSQKPAPQMINKERKNNTVSNEAKSIKKETASDTKTELTREYNNSFRTAQLIRPLLASVVEGS